MKKILTLVVASALSFPSFADERHIELEGQSNFRDIGGYETTQGNTVKWNAIYRSGELPRLTDADVEVLAELEIGTVINFLTDVEIDVRGHDRLPEGIESTSLPISGGDEDMIQVLLEARQTGDFSLVPLELNAEFHRVLVSDVTNQQYAEFLRLVADENNHPVVFHCSHGVHRTGTATAILLSAVGVPWDTIRDDYLLSNKYRSQENSIRLAQLRELASKTFEIPLEEVDMANAEAFYLLEAEYIDASLKQILNNFGSMENYIIDGLGLTAEELAKLRTAILI